MDFSNSPEQHGATPVVLGFVVVYPAEHVYRGKQFSKDRFYLYQYFFDDPDDSG